MSDFEFQASGHTIASVGHLRLSSQDNVHLPSPFLLAIWSQLGMTVSHVPTTPEHTITANLFRIFF